MKEMMMSLLIVLSLPMSSTLLVADELVKLKNEATGRCLNIDRARHDFEGGPVTSATCDLDEDQRWKLVRLVNGNIKLENRGTGRCLNIHRGRHDFEGGPVTSYACAETLDQEWRLIGLSDGDVKLKNRSTGRCLNIHRGRHDFEGGPITSYSCANTPDQEWELIRVGGGDTTAECMPYYIEGTGRSLAAFRGARKRRAKRRAIRRWRRAVEGRLVGSHSDIPAAGTAYSDWANAKDKSVNCSGRPLKCVARARPCREPR